MQLAESFMLNEDGYALLQKFIVHRMEMDLKSEQLELELLKDKQQQTSQKSGFLNTINRFQKDKSVKKIQERIRKKENWMNKYIILNFGNLHSPLKEESIQGMVSRFSHTATGHVQLFLILQEVVHTPIFNKQESFEDAGEEKYFEKAINEISQLCRLNGIGQKIIDDTKSFYKDIKRENANILKWGLYGLIGVSAVAAMLAVPVFAPAIGGLMGLSGAAATTSGLAILGGGSIAAGGLGMAGGMTVLVGGSGILGAIAGGAAGKLISQLPQEAIALSVVKIVNLINFLKHKDHPDDANSGDSLSNAKSLFLEFKHASEKELILNGIQKDKKEIMKFLDILNVGLKRII